MSLSERTPRAGAAILLALLLAAALAIWHRPARPPVSNIVYWGEELVVPWELHELNQRLDITQNVAALHAEAPDPAIGAGGLLDQQLRATIYENNRSPRFWIRLAASDALWSEVESALVAAGLPRSLAAIPYVHSRFHPESFDAMTGAAGPWHLLPGVGGLERLGCRTREGRVDNPPLEDHLRGLEDSFLDASCERDDRRDLARATAVAVPLLRQTWDQHRLSLEAAPLVATIAVHASQHPGVVLGVAALRRCFEDARRSGRPRAEICGEIVPPDDETIAGWARALEAPLR